MNIYGGLIGRGPAPLAATRLNALERTGPRPPYRPDDFKDYVCMATACGVIGAVKFPCEWTGKEVETDMPTWLPERPPSSTLLFTDAQKLSVEAITKCLDHVFPARDLELDQNNLAGLLGEPLWSDEEWECICEFNESVRAYAFEARNRWLAVCRTVRDLGAEGRLDFALRPREGGGWIHDQLLADHWITERYEPRLRYGEFNPVKPLHFNLDDPGNLLIFVERASLQNVVASLRVASTRVSSPDCAKPTICRDWSRLPGHLPTICEIAAGLPEATADKPWTVEALANFIKCHPQRLPNMTQSRAKEWARVIHGAEQGNRRPQV